MSKLKTFLDEDDNSVAKAAVYYLICQLLIKGISFITTPIFTRILTKGEYGEVSNFFAWQAMLLPLVTLDLRVTINRARYEYEKDNDSYLASILLTSNIITLLVLMVIELNQAFFINIFSMSMFYIRIMFLYIIFQTAFDYQQIQYNIFHKYRKYVFYTVLSTVASVLLAVGLVVLVENKMAGRILGTVIPAIIVDVIIYINILKRANRLSFKYVMYAVYMAVPLIPSALSSTILSTSDRAMIMNICGSEQTALYSVAYSVSAIAGILWTALNQAWSPWLYDKFKEEKFREVKNFSNKFSLFYAVLIIGIMLVAPEIVLIMGGRLYMSTIAVMPPVILAMVCQFFYAFYFNTEYFYGETYIISLGTTIAAVLNLGLNYLFIPRFGYIAAAYTTLAGYTTMYLYHYLIVKYRMNKAFLFDNKFLVTIAAILCVIQYLISFVYENYIVRYSAIGVYCIVLFVIAVVKKDIIMEFIGKFIKKRG